MSKRGKFRLVELGYGARKHAKIERALAQARDRSAMIPVEQVLRDLVVDRSAVWRVYG